MKKTIQLVTLLIIPVLLGSCAGLRSANGLAKGELSVGYTAPAGGAIRYGITDNVEVRAYNSGESRIAGDLFLHTHSAHRPLNVGLTFGTNYDLSNYQEEDEQKIFYYAGGTVDYKLNNHIRPYLNYTFSTTSSESLQHQFSFGTEFTFHFTKQKTVGVIIAPEMSYFPEAVSILGDASHFWPNVQVGFTFDFAKIFDF